MDTYCDACLKSLTTQHFYSYNGYVLIMSNVNGVLVVLNPQRVTAQQRRSPQLNEEFQRLSAHCPVLQPTTLLFWFTPLSSAPFPSAAGSSV